MELALIVILLLVAYFLPFIIANHREHNNQLAIFLVNLLAGWSIIFWLVALIWAFTGNTRFRDEQLIRHGRRQAAIRKTADLPN